MDTIYFLIADTVQERMIEQTLWSYQESFNTRHVAIKIEIIDFPRLLDQARAMIRRGARVIITNSYCPTLPIHASASLPPAV